MDGVAPVHMKSKLRTIKYVIDEGQEVVSYDTSGQDRNKWILKAFSNIDWAGSKDDMTSITGYYIYPNI